MESLIKQNEEDESNYTIYKIYSENGVKLDPPKIIKIYNKPTIPDVNARFIYRIE